MLSKRARQRGLERMRRYVADLVPLFRLQAWDVVVEDAHPDPDTVAQCRYRQTLWRARLRFADQHLIDSPEEQRATVAHELLHIVDVNRATAHEQAIEGLNATAQDWAKERNHHETEREIEQLALIIAPFLPLPPQD